MNVQFSQIIELGEPLRTTHKAASPDSVFTVVARRLLKMRIASQLPRSCPLDQLTAHDSIDESGSGDLTLRWAAQRANDGTLERWSLQLIHPDREDARLFRQIEVHCRSNGKQSSVVGVRALYENPYGVFLDKEPPIAPPGVVADLLEHWIGSRGGVKVARRFLHLREHARIGARIASTDRDIPVVVAGPVCFARSEPIVVHRRFAAFERLLGGSVSPVGLPTPGDVDNFNRKVDPSQGLPEGYDCAILWPIEPGSSQQQLLERRTLYRAHDFRSGEEFAHHVFDLVVKRSTFLDAGALQSVESLRARQLAAAQQVAQQAARQGEDKAREAEDLLKAALEDNTRLVGEIAELNNHVESLKKDLYDQRARTHSLVLSRSTKQPAGLGVSFDRPWMLFEGCSIDSAVAAVAKFMTLGYTIAEGGDRAVVVNSSLESARSNRHPQPIKILQVMLFASVKFLDAVRRGATNPELKACAEDSGFAYAHGESVPPWISWTVS